MAKRTQDSRAAGPVNFQTTGRGVLNPLELGPVWQERPLRGKRETWTRGYEGITSSSGVAKCTRGECVLTASDVGSITPRPELTRGAALAGSGGDLIRTVVRIRRGAHVLTWGLTQCCLRKTAATVKFQAIGIPRKIAGFYGKQSKKIKLDR